MQMKLPSPIKYVVNHPWSIDCVYNEIRDEQADHNGPIVMQVSCQLSLHAIHTPSGEIEILQEINLHEAEQRYGLRIVDVDLTLCAKVYPTVEAVVEAGFCADYIYHSNKRGHMVKVIDDSGHPDAIPQGLKGVLEMHIYVEADHKLETVEPTF